MNIKHSSLVVAAFCLGVSLLSPVESPAQTPFEPTPGQAGKDVVWVPTPPELVEKMLDMAQVTPKDFVMDLGSGDGRNIIAAARRGARSIGVEYNPEMVTLSQRLAKEAGVADKATFVQGDMYEADISKATVLALFLLPSNLDKLAPKFLALKPGTRIVLNTFLANGWTADRTEATEEPCSSWCNAHLIIVPAKVAGTWRFGGNELTLTQDVQILSGTLGSAAASAPIVAGRMLGDQITFTVGDTVYTGRVDGDRIEGSFTAGGKKQSWNATRRR